MPETSAPETSGGLVHISSAVVRCLPASLAAVRDAIDALDGVDIVLAEGNKLVVIIEGDSSGAVGARLTRIAAHDGVVSAAMVYEQIEPLESLGEQA